MDKKERKELFHFIFSWDTLRDIGKDMKCMWRGHPLSKTDQELLKFQSKRPFILRCARCGAPVVGEIMHDKRYRTRLADNEDIPLD